MTWRLALQLTCAFCCGYFIGWARTTLGAYKAGRRDALLYPAIQCEELERIARL